MRVLLAHKFYRITGGADFFFFETGRVLENNGHDVACFSTNHPDNVEGEWNKYFIDPPDYNSPSILRKLSSVRNIIYSANAKRAFAKLIVDFKPDIVHAFGIYTHLTPSILEASQEAGIPVVMSCNDYKHTCPNYKLYAGGDICEACKGYKFFNATRKKCCNNSFAFSVASSIEAYIHEYKNVHDRYVDRYLFASEFMLNKTKEFWSDKCFQYGILKNPFDTSQYQPVYTGKYALYFGRIIGEKGVDHIISAARSVDIPIKIIGDGPDLNMLKDEVVKYGLNHVEFLGEKWGEELTGVLNSAQFVIVPSLWHENYPYVIFQAFAAGKPVLGAHRGGIPELIGNDKGILFEPNEPDALAVSMSDLWNDKEKCQRMGKVAREFIVREFTEDNFYKSLMLNYQAVIQ